MNRITLLLCFTLWLTFELTATANPAVHYGRQATPYGTIDLVTVDLNSPDIELRPLLAPAGETLPATTLLAQGGRPLAAITGTFFDTISGIVVGNVVSEGRLLTEGSVGSVLKINDVGHACIASLQGKLGRHIDWSGTQFAISAGPTLLIGGQQAIAPASEGFRDPGLYGYRLRAAMGVTPDNKLLLLTTRRAISLHELASIFQQLGAIDAVNLDGGSSSMLAYEGRLITAPYRRLTNLIGVYQRGTAPSQSTNLGEQYAKAYQHSIKAKRLFKNRDLVKAHSEMRRAIAMAPDRAPYWEDLAKIQQASRKTSDAANSYIKAAELYLERSQTEKALICAELAFELDPNLQSQHPSLGNIAHPEPALSN